MVEKLKLPDFDDMLKLGEEIGLLKTRLMLLEYELEQAKSNISSFVLSHPDLWGNDKKEPSNAHIRDTFHVIGYDDATKDILFNLRTSIASATGQLKSKENIFKVYEDLIGVWRTQSANERYDNS